jgi:hypothetical protein
MKLRSHLLLLTLGTILPLLVFALIAVGLLAQRERTIFESSARERALALLATIDADLDNSMTALREQALRVLPTQLGWRDIHLALPSGQPDAVRRARDAGFDEHVLKPIAPDQLVRLIDVACAAKAKRAGGRPSA